MRILCCEQFSQIGGGQRSLLDLLPAFRTEGWQVRVACPGEGALATEVRRLCCSTAWLHLGTYRSIHKPPSQIWQYASELPRLARDLHHIAEEYNAGLLYVNGARLLPAAAWVAWRAGIPLVFHCHSRLSQQTAVFAAGQSLRLSRAHVIACCHHSVESLRRYISEPRLSIVYNGVEGPPPGLQKSGGSRRPRVGVIGRIEEEKGQLAFVRAARHLARAGMDCLFYVVGAHRFSSPAYCEQVMAASRGLPVEFTGWQPDVWRALANLDLLVVPSGPLEATTRVILEAYSSGVPVVAFPAGGIPEVVMDGETGFLARGHTALALAERIVEVLSMRPEDVARVVNNARSLWARKFRLELYQSQVCAVLARAAELNRGVAA